MAAYYTDAEKRTSEKKGSLAPVSGIAMDRHSSSKANVLYSMSTDRKDIVGHEMLRDRQGMHLDSITHAYLCTA